MIKIKEYTDVNDISLLHVNDYFITEDGKNIFQIYAIKEDTNTIASIICNKWDTEEDIETFTGIDKGTTFIKVIIEDNPETSKLKTKKQIFPLTLASAILKSDKTPLFVFLADAEYYNNYKTVNKSTFYITNTDKIYLGTIALTK